MNSNCEASVIHKIQTDERELGRYKLIATRDCYNYGGISSINYCPNTQYLYTTTEEILGSTVCINVHQCIGFTWKCSRSSGGSI